MFWELLLATQLSAGGMGFNEAKAFADRHEAALERPQTAQLLASQANVAGRSFATCMPSPAPKSLPSFTVVLMLDGTGKPQRSWLKGDAEFARCVERQFTASVFFQPPSAPFYTSFEFTFEP